MTGLGCLLAALLTGQVINAQDIVLTGSNSASINGFAGETLPSGPQVTYASYTSTSSIVPTSTALTGVINGLLSSMAAANGTSSRSSSTTQSYTLLNGSPVTLSVSNSSATSSSARPVNTQPCNNYPEFCSRKYSNITEVAAHNSAFTVKNNAASNQQLDVIDQLNDGIRMLQGQTHKVNGSIWCCHTSCDLLNAGTLEAYLTKVAGWVESHPFDVVTILLGNSDFVDVTDYVAPIQAAGLDTYAYVPPKVPMTVEDWPTLSQMILTRKRVVFFMDYKANQTAVPWILDEFSQLWETPFSPEDRDFPCTVQRPPDLKGNATRNRLFMANHNLNTEVSLAGVSLLIPNTALINVTNGVSGYGSLGVAANSCTGDWGRPPNFLLVDFYNNPNNGSVFEVAARANNVTYKRKCCGLVPSTASLLHPLHGWLVATLLTTLLSLSV